MNTCVQYAILFQFTMQKMHKATNKQICPNNEWIVYCKNYLKLIEINVKKDRIESVMHFCNIHTHMCRDELLMMVFWAYCIFVWKWIQLNCSFELNYNCRMPNSNNILSLASFFSINKNNSLQKFFFRTKFSSNYESYLKNSISKKNFMIFKSIFFLKKLRYSDTQGGRS